VHGETETGATLHEMVEKPDAGRIVDQQAVPILPNDTAHEVFSKVTVAAEIVMARSLPSIVNGAARPVAADLQSGSYFGGRKPADGRIDWSQDAWTVHNLVRAVAPPYPGAFSEIRGHRLAILQTWWQGKRTTLTGAPTLFVQNDRLVLRCANGGLLDVLRAEVDGRPLTFDSFSNFFGSQEISLT
jgi:methionyl-tRNA formyltransferase